MSGKRTKQLRKAFTAKMETNHVTSYEPSWWRTTKRAYSRHVINKDLSMRYK